MGSRCVRALHYCHPLGHISSISSPFPIPKPQVTFLIPFFLPSLIHLKWLHHLLAVQSWASYFPSLGLKVSIYELWITVAPVSWSLGIPEWSTYVGKVQCLVYNMLYISGNYIGHQAAHILPFPPPLVMSWL